MPRFHLRFRDNSPIHDEIALELVGFDDARQEAFLSLVEISQGTIPEGDSREWIIDVQASEGAPVLEAELSIGSATQIIAADAQLATPPHFWAACIDSADQKYLPPILRPASTTRKIVLRARHCSLCLDQE